MLQHHESNPQRFLDRLTSRSVLSEREKQEILSLPVNARQASPNEDFVRLGERVNHACFVVDGLVGRFDQNAAGGRQITALHIPGDMPDLHSVVQPTATSALQRCRLPRSSIFPTARFVLLRQAILPLPRHSGVIAWWIP